MACWLLPRFNSNTVGCATLCMTLDWINKGFALSTFLSDIAEGFGEGTAQFSCKSASYIVVTSQSAYAITVPRSCLMTYLYLGLDFVSHLVVTWMFVES